MTDSRAFNRLVTGSIIACILVGGVVVKRHESVQARQGAQARDALCIFRDGLHYDVVRNARKVREGERFVRAHPGGALGYTHAQLMRLQAQEGADLRIQRARLAALSGIDCPTVRR